MKRSIILVINVLLKKMYWFAAYVQQEPVLEPLRMFEGKNGICEKLVLSKTQKDYIFIKKSSVSTLSA